MSKKILIVLAAAGAAALGVTGVGYAQRGEAKADTATEMRGMHGMSGMSAMMDTMRDCPMMQGMAQGPAAALEHRDSLGLSDAQVRKLETIRARAEKDRSGVMERMESVHRETVDVGAAERFDEAAVRRALTRMGELHADMGVAMLHARHATRETLTPEQREKLGRLGVGMTRMQGMQGMSGMMGMMEMMGGMMQHCPMMQRTQGTMPGGRGGSRMQRPHGTPVPPQNQI